MKGYWAARSDGVWTGVKNIDVPDSGVSDGLVIPNAGRLGDGGRLSLRPKPPTLGEAMGAARVAALNGVVRRLSLGGMPAGFSVNDVCCSALESEGRGGTGGGLNLEVEGAPVPRLVFMGGTNRSLLFVSRRASFGSIPVLLRIRIPDVAVGVLGNGRLAVVVLGDGEGEAS